MLLVSLEMNPVISIHAPRTGSDERVTVRLTHTSAFQSTLPARGATTRTGKNRNAPHYFNPRSPHGERHFIAFKLRRWIYFNPRSPHGERLRSAFTVASLVIFQSTLPARGATMWPPIWCGSRPISIHAPRMGSDARTCGSTRRHTSFQSTLPAWGATPDSPATIPKPPFQSTLPAWGATRGRLSGSRRVPISIHAPRMGSDDGVLGYSPIAFEFQSTLPAWGATTRRPQRRRNQPNFNPRSPHGERPDGK